MHYYQHNIGDYRRDTGYLTLLEHGVYRQLLDWYYLDEKPIPRETQEVCRRLSAKTQEEIEAVESVLKDFFVLSNGWRHKRCDAQIKEYQARSQTSRVNGKLGGRPKKTQGVISRNPDKTQEKGNQKPLTINQEPRTKLKESTKENRTPSKPKPPKKQETELSDDFTISENVRKWAERKGFRNLEAHFENFCISCRAKRYTYVNWDAALQKAISSDWAKLNGTHGAPAVNDQDEWMREIERESFAGNTIEQKMNEVSQNES